MARRSLRHLTQRYNDKEIKCIVCFVCGGPQVTVRDIEDLEWKQPISFKPRTFFSDVERNCPGSLLNNCSYDLWKGRYVDDLRTAAERDSNMPDRNYYLRKAMDNARERAGGDAAWMNEWTLEVRIESRNAPARTYRLLGCTEDAFCASPVGDSTGVSPKHL